MNKQQIQQKNIEQTKKYGFQDQKQKLHSLLKEQSNCKFKQMQIYDPSNSDKNQSFIDDKKRYSSQATQIQDDLLDYDESYANYYNLIQQEESQDEQNVSQDKSQDDSIIMQSRYEKGIKKHFTPETTFIQKKKKILQKKIQNPSYHQQITNDLVAGESFKAIMRRCSSNLSSIKQEINQTQKQDNNSTQLNNNCFPSITNNASEIKKRIQINYKEVYKLFCSKIQQQEDDDKVSKTKFYGNQYNVPKFSANYRTPLNTNNKFQRFEYQLLQPKSNYYRISSPDYDQQPLTVSKFFSKANSRKSSIEESKIQHKDWNLAKFDSIQENSLKNENIKLNTNQIYDLYSQKLIEKYKLAQNKYVQDNRLNRQNDQLVKRNQLQLADCSSIQINQQQQIQPKCLLKKYFSVNYLKLKSSQHSPNKKLENSDILHTMLTIKQMDNFSSNQQIDSKFGSQKNLLSKQSPYETWRHNNKTCDQGTQNENVFQGKLQFMKERENLQMDKKYLENYYS